MEVRFAEIVGFIVRDLLADGAACHFMIIWTNSGITLQR
jgi:hypothetical protein